MAKEITKQTYNTTTFRFALEPYRGKSSRHDCPQCRKPHTFARYIDLTTGDYVGDYVGRCNREVRCGYHAAPTAEHLKKDEKLIITTNEVKEEFLHLTDRMDLINAKYVVESLSNYEDNKFVQFLLKYFNKEDVMKTLNLYKVGTSDKWKGATVFWQIDEELDVRTGKIMLYNEEDGKRIKQPYNHITWFHTPDNKNYGDYNLKQCFFGQHLIKEDDTRTICVVESEKTAVICNLSKTGFIWIATGGLQNISEERMKSLSGRKVVFYPDKGSAFDEWCSKINPYIELGDFKVSNYLNQQDSLEEGDDLADLIIQKMT